MSTAAASPWPGKSGSIMLVAGEASGDQLASELVLSLKHHPAATAAPFPIRFFGAGGPQMRAAGVELELDLTQHAVFGLFEALRHYTTFSRILNRLLALAFSRQPDVIIFVDYSGFNRRLAAAIQARLRSRGPGFNNWKPKLVYFVSPQVWASRSGRAYQLERDIDLLLSIFPFEKAWYAQRTPRLKVEFIGHPMVDRAARTPPAIPGPTPATPRILLLPGSRRGEVSRHLPILLQALELIRASQPITATLVVPNPQMETFTRTLAPLPPWVEIQVGHLQTHLRAATLALACSGTVTMECAFARLPTIVIYKVAKPTYWIARSIIQVRHIAMPNLLADQTVYPELIQHNATPARIAEETLRLLSSPEARSTMHQAMEAILHQLGPLGATDRAAEAIVNLLLTNR